METYNKIQYSQEQISRLGSATLKEKENSKQ